MAIYSDLNSISPTTKPVLADIESVYQALFNIFNTNPGERIFSPEFGLNLDEELFELIDDLTSAEVYRRIIEAVERWEPRVKINKKLTTVDAYPDNNKYDVVVVFDIRGVEGQLFEFKGSVTK